MGNREILQDIGYTQDAQGSAGEMTDAQATDDLIERLRASAEHSQWCGWLSHARLDTAAATEIAHLRAALAAAQAGPQNTDDQVEAAFREIAVLCTDESEFEMAREATKRALAAIRALRPPAAPAEMPCSVTVEDNDGRGFLMSASEPAGADGHGSCANCGATWYTPGADLPCPVCTSPEPAGALAAKILRCLKWHYGAEASDKDSAAEQLIAELIAAESAGAPSEIMAQDKAAELLTWAMCAAASGGGPGVCDPKHCACGHEAVAITRHLYADGVVLALLRREG